MTYILWIHFSDGKVYNHNKVQFLDITTVLSNVDYVTSTLNKRPYSASKAARKAALKSRTNHLQIFIIRSREGHFLWLLFFPTKWKTQKNIKARSGHPSSNLINEKRLANVEVIFVVGVLLSLVFDLQATEWR